MSTNYKQIIKRLKKKHGDGFATTGLCEIYDLIQANDYRKSECIRFSKKGSLHLSKLSHDIKTVKLSANGDSDNNFVEPEGIHNDGSFWGYLVPIQFEWVIQKLISWIGYRFQFIIDALSSIPISDFVDSMGSLGLKNLENLDVLYSKVTYNDDSTSTIEDKEENRNVLLEYIKSLYSIFKWVFEILRKTVMKRTIREEEDGVSSTGPTPTQISKSLQDIENERTSLLSEVFQWTQRLVGKSFNMIGRVITQTYSFVKTIKDTIFSLITNSMTTLVESVSSIVGNLSMEMGFKDPDKTRQPKNLSSVINKMRNSASVKSSLSKVKKKFIKIFLFYTQTMNKMQHAKTTNSSEDKSDDISHIMIHKIYKKLMSIVSELLGLSSDVRSSLPLKNKFTEGILKLSSLFGTLEGIKGPNITNKFIHDTLSKSMDIIQRFMGNVIRITKQSIRVLIKVFLNGFVLSNASTLMYKSLISPLFDYSDSRQTERLYNFLGFKIVKPTESTTTTTGDADNNEETTPLLKLLKEMDLFFIEKGLLLTDKTEGDIHGLRKQSSNIASENTLESVGDDMKNPGYQENDMKESLRMTPDQLLLNYFSDLAKGSPLLPQSVELMKSIERANDHINDVKASINMIPYSKNLIHTNNIGTGTSLIYKLLTNKGGNIITTRNDSKRFRDIRKTSSDALEHFFEHNNTLEEIKLDVTRKGFDLIKALFGNVDKMSKIVKRSAHDSEEKIGKSKTILRREQRIRKDFRSFIKLSQPPKVDDDDSDDSSSSDSISEPDTIPDMIVRGGISMRDMDNESFSMLTKIEQSKLPVVNLSEEETPKTNATIGKLKTYLTYFLIGTGVISAVLIGLYSTGYLETIKDMLTEGFYDIKDRTREYLREPSDNFTEETSDYKIFLDHPTTGFIFNESNIIMMNIPEFVKNDPLFLTNSTFYNNETLTNNTISIVYEESTKIADILKYLPDAVIEALEDVSISTNAMKNIIATGLSKSLDTAKDTTSDFVDMIQESIYSNWVIKAGKDAPSPDKPLAEILKYAEGVSFNESNLHTATIRFIYKNITKESTAISSWRETSMPLWLSNYAHKTISFIMSSMDGESLKAVKGVIDTSKNMFDVFTNTLISIWETTIKFVSPTGVSLTVFGDDINDSGDSDNDNNKIELPMKYKNFMRDFIQKIELSRPSTKSSDIEKVLYRGTGMRESIKNINKDDIERNVSDILSIGTPYKTIRRLLKPSKLKEFITPDISDLFLLTGFSNIGMYMTRTLMGPNSIAYSLISSSVSYLGLDEYIKSFPLVNWLNGIIRKKDSLTSKLVSGFFWTLLSLMQVMTSIRTSDMLINTIPELGMRTTDIFPYMPSITASLMITYLSYNVLVKTGSMFYENYIHNDMRRKSIF